MTVTPDPDPTSRYPTRYCKACGNGFPAYVSCNRWDGEANGCDFTGEVEMTAEIQAIADAFAEGRIPAHTRSMPVATWANLKPPAADPWSNLVPPPLKTPDNG